MGKATLFAGVLLAWASTADTAVAALTFAPATGYSAEEVWAGTDASHFAVENGNFYILGAEEVAADQFQNVVRVFNGTSTIEIGRSPVYTTNTYFPDAITVVDGEVYWAHARGHPSYDANVYKTSFNGSAWETTTVLDESEGIGAFSLSTDGNGVFGVGLDDAGSNVAFFFDDADQYDVFADIPGDGSGGSGFDPAGNFFAGAWSVGGDYMSHMYEFSAEQVGDRLDGTQATPYTATDAIDDHFVPGNASAVMESDGADLFGTEYNATWTGTDPYAFDLDSGVSTSLGTLSGADTSVSTDMYYRDGDVFFMGKNDWVSGGEAVIYRVVPEPTSLCLLAGGALLGLRHRCKPERKR